MAEDDVDLDYGESDPARWEGAGARGQEGVGSPSPESPVTRMPGGRDEERDARPARRELQQQREEQQRQLSEEQRSRMLERQLTVFRRGHVPRATCTRCFLHGHRSRECGTELELVPCTRCGQHGHEHFRCPSRRQLQCDNCGLRGHVRQTCREQQQAPAPAPAALAPPPQPACELCGQVGKHQSGCVLGEAERLQAELNAAKQVQSLKRQLAAVQEGEAERVRSPARLKVCVPESGVIHSDRRTRAAWDQWEQQRRS